MELINITSENYRLALSGRWKLVFWVPWAKPSVECMRHSETQPFEGSVGLINVEENRELSEQHSVFIYPTTIYMLDGGEQSRDIGFEVY